MIARTITVNFQTRNKQTTTPKGRIRRTVPMTTRLHDALKRMSVIRDGLVVRNLDGSAKSDDQADKAIQRICRRAAVVAYRIPSRVRSSGVSSVLSRRGS